MCGHRFLVRSFFMQGSGLIFLHWRRLGGQCLLLQYGRALRENRHGSHIGSGRGSRFLCRTPVAGDGLPRKQTIAIPLDGRLDQRGGLCQADIGPRLRGTAVDRLDRRWRRALNSIFRQGLTRQRERNRRPSVCCLRFGGWFDRPGDLSAGCFLPCLLSGLRWPKALAAAAATTPTPGSILKLSARRLTGGALGPSHRGTVAPRFFFYGTRLPALGFPSLGGSGRLFAIPRNSLEVGGVFLLLHEVGDIEKRIPLQTQVDESGLHPGEHAGNATFVNGAGESVFILALVIDFCELIVFKDGQTRLMRRTGNTNLF